MNRKCFSIAVLILVSFLFIFYVFPNFLLTLELKVYDSFVKVNRVFHRQPPKLEEIIIVALDDLSFWKMEKKWPYSRAVYADLLDRLSRGRPKMIVFDIVFRGEGEDKQGDDLFAQMLQGKDNILLPYYLGKKGVHIRSEKDFTNIVGQAGFINKPLDSDGYVRKVYPLRVYLSRKIKDYATELYIFSRYYNYGLTNIILKNNRIILDKLNPAKEDKFKRWDFLLADDDTALINYRADINDFHVVSMYKVFLDNFDASIFKDKIVFVGLTSDIFHDVHDTPLGLMPGIGIIANTSLMFLNGSFILEIPLWLKWLVIILLCFFIVFVCYRLSILKGLLFTISIIAITIAITFSLFRHNYYLNPFKLILVCLVGYITINFYKYASVVIENMTLRRLSTIDELTGLYVFRYFKIVLNHEFEKCLRYKMPLSLLMIDIDNFKKINDTYGHQKGNIVLSKIGKIVLNSVRRADFPARYGGEELSVLLPNSDIEGVQKCAEAIRSRIENQDYFMTDTGPLKVTVSIGVSSYPMMNISSSDEMIKFADTALYEAKRQGKNRVIVFKPEQQ